MRRARNEALVAHCKHCPGGTVENHDKSVNRAVLCTEIRNRSSNKLRSFSDSWHHECLSDRHSYLLVWFCFILRGPISFRQNSPGCREEPRHRSCSSLEACVIHTLLHVFISTSKYVTSPHDLSINDAKMHKVLFSSACFWTYIVKPSKITEIIYHKWIETVALTVQNYSDPCFWIIIRSACLTHHSMKHQFIGYRSNIHFRFREAVP
jgi:hypothetical protein